MKKKISLLLCAGLLLSMLTGCSGGKLDLTWFTSKFTGKTAEDIQQEQESAAAEEAAAPEATAVVTEVFNDISSFGLAYQKNYGVHPYDCESLNNRCILSFLYEPLFVVSSENFEASPVLASSYEVSDDGLTTTVHLRPEACFSDGSPLTAQDAAYSLISSRGTVYYGSRLRHVTSIAA
ncbi:MAG: ABC transporter substrate-binding protein [Oscillospiraceae bacterium]